jgi:hypothetical protein
MTTLFGTLWIIICVVLAVIAIAGEWKAFEKANQPGWACIVPFYNIYIMLKIAGKPGWWLLLFLIPGVNLVFAIWTMNMVSKSFGKDEGFTLGLIFFGFIFWPILGFGDAQYQGPYGDPEAYRAYQESHAVKGGSSFL